jgi:hypothetical protein
MKHHKTIKNCSISNGGDFGPFGFILEESIGFQMKWFQSHNPIVSALEFVAIIY